MKKTLTLAIFILAFGFFGNTKAEAQTYVVNTLDGSSSCGQYCDQLNQYLVSQGQSPYGVSYNNNSNYNSGGSYNNASPLIYPANGSSGYGANSNGYNQNGSSGTDGYNYVQYPYQVYQYFQNPNSSTNGVNGNSMGGIGGAYQAYPTPIYHYYSSNGGTSATTSGGAGTAVGTTAGTSHSVGTSYNTSNQNTGFVLTSGR